MNADNADQVQFDSVQVGVPDVGAAAREYEVLLGRKGARHGELHRFQFARGAVELIPAEPGVRSLRFHSSTRDARPVTRDETHGIAVLLDAPRREEVTSPFADDVPNAIDHVVIQSPNLDRAISLWRDRLGVRLALDREFPQRGLRLLFFRSAGVTLEFSGALAPAADGHDTLWGIAYQVADVAACRERLLAAGAQVSEVRPGNKKGTFVATAKSHTLGVPTLLIQPVR